MSIPLKEVREAVYKRLVEDLGEENVWPWSVPADHGVTVPVALSGVSAEPEMRVKAVADALAVEATVEVMAAVNDHEAAEEMLSAIEASLGKAELALSGGYRTVIRHFGSAELFSARLENKLVVQGSVRYRWTVART